MSNLGASSLLGLFLWNQLEGMCYTESSSSPLGVLLEYLSWVNFSAEKSRLCAEMSPRYKLEHGLSGVSQEVPF